ncbi:hypothetical protein CR513_53249, partial [Mucuna pruriens]
MFFGLKNFGTTYQQAMIALFQNMMHKEIKMYYKLRLNLAKYTFWVRSGNLLGFVFSIKGIEFDLNKTRTTLEMLTPMTEKELRGFLGRLNYIARFVSQLPVTCSQIFKLLHKHQKSLRRSNNTCESLGPSTSNFKKTPYYVLDGAQ